MLKFLKSLFVDPVSRITNAQAGSSQLLLFHKGILHDRNPTVALAGTKAVRGHFRKGQAVRVVAVDGKSHLSKISAFTPKSLESVSKGYKGGVYLEIEPQKIKKWDVVVPA